MSRTLPRTDDFAAPASRSAALLCGLGLAVPDQRERQDDATEEMARAWSLRGTDLERWRRIVAGSGIDYRHGVAPVADIIDLTTRQRMQRYEQHAPHLAAAAAEEALRDAGVQPDAVTDLVVVSCTGFSAPGVDAALVERLGLRPDVQRTLIGFMGCFGAINGMRAGAAACAARPGATALVICVELCSLHIRGDSDSQNQVASALFADGAAAAVLRDDASPGGNAVVMGVLERGASLLLSEGRDWMTWRVTDAGFAMTLSRQVPVAVRRHVGSFVESLAAAPATYAVHPGGPGILDAVEAGLGGEAPGVCASRHVLRQYGNMSSPTVLFVLREIWRRRGRQALPCALLAFGPGLSLEGLVLRSIESEAT